MTDSLKFGPEWLRMSSSTSNPSSSNSAAVAALTANSAPRYPLSEFRYGREEMLALFDKNIKHPELLPRYKYLFVEKMQCPLALTPSAEDDQVAARMWPMRSSPGLSARGGRGGIMDRGRGRGRGAYHSVAGNFSRSSLFPEEDGGRVMGRGERWSERNGTEPGDWASGLPSTSPRKEYNSHGRGASIESWRRPRTEEDAPLEQWRSGSLGPREPTKWGRSTSWREEDPTLAESSRGYNNDRGYTEPRAGGGPNNRSMNRRQWDNMPDDNLPEWAVDNPLESGGSFDATGAFHGSDDDLVGPDAARHNLKASRKELNGGGGGGGGGSEEEERTSRHRHHEGKESPAGEEGPTNGGASSEGAEGSPTIPDARSPALDDGPKGGENAAGPTVVAPNAANVDRMQEVADSMVEKLIMDDELSLLSEDKEKKMMAEEGKLMKGGQGVPPPPVNETEWFYRDPQDMVQGPFSAVEMAEWYQAGYFDNNLCVRRKNDQRFSKLGDLIDMCGGEMPFFVPYRALPMQLGGVPPPVDAQPLKGPPILPHRLNPAMMDMDPNIDPRVLRQNYIASQQALVYQKLSSSDMWHMLSPEQQRQMIRKHVAQLPIPDSIYGLQSAIAAGDANMTPFGIFDLMNKPPPPLDGNGGPVDSAILQKKMQQQQRILPPGQGQPHLPMMPLPPDFPAVLNPADPLHQMMHNSRMGFLQGQPPNNAMPSMIPPQQQPPVPPTGGSAAENDRIKTLLMQLSMQKGMQPQPGGFAALSQMMLSQQQQQQLQQQHLQKQQQQQPGMVPWPLGGGDPLKGQPLGGMMPNAGGNNAGWMGLEGPGGPSNGPSLDLGRGGVGVGNNPGAGGIWELEHKLFSNNGTAKPIEMKTEKQIIEEQQMAAAAAAALQQQQKEKEHEENHQQMAQLQAADQVQQQQQQQMQQVNEASDSKGWTKVEAKGAPGKVDVNQKDKKNEAEKNAKKKEAAAQGTAKGAGQPQQQQQAGQKSQEGVAKKATAGQQESKQQQQQQPQKAKATAAANNKSQPAKGSNNNSNNNSNAKSVAPWSINQPQQEAPGLTLAEIQKMELEQQRAEQARMDQVMQQQQQHQQQWFDIQNLKADLPKWNAPQIAPSVVKSLAEIQAEEQAKLRQWQETAAAGAAAAAAASQQVAAVAKKAVEEAPGAVWGSMKVWSSNGQAPSSMGGFWEEPVKSVTASRVVAGGGGGGGGGAAAGKTIAKSQTMSSIQSKPTAAGGASGQGHAKANAATGQKGNNKQAAAAGVATVAATSNATTNGGSGGKKEAKGGKGNKRDDASGQEFTQWCTKALSAYNSTIDIPTFVSFLQDIESPYEVKDYIRVYLGETKECTDFCKQFLERRSKYKNQIRAQNAHVDDMCSPAPALTPSSDFQEVTGKAKKVKKNKMMKLDSRILGFSVTAAQDRINVGDRDYPNAS